ncbi:MAG TPA: hypothetical protein VFJ06_14505, partial [Halococcus sp.]|nr:hypothetical protein [Halococcus sp.]
MSDGEATSSDERASVGVVAPEADERRIVDAIADAGGVSNVGSAETVAESAAVVAVGDTALSDLAAAGVSAPVLPVAAGVTGVPLDDARRAIERVLAEEYERRELPFVYVDTDEESGHALFNVSLTTAELGTISEFAVETLCEPSSRDSADAPVARFRADGVVVATPAGSRGYARAAGGPVVVPGSEVLSVVPIAPFSTDPDHWVLPL